MADSPPIDTLAHKLDVQSDQLRRFISVHPDPTPADVLVFSEVGNPSERLHQRVAAYLRAHHRAHRHRRDRLRRDVGLDNTDT